MRKHVIVTGGAQGIGRKTVEKLVSNNYSVSVFEVDEEALAECQAIPEMNNVAWFKVDISKDSAVKQAVQDAYNRFGNVYALVNNAAIQVNKTITELDVNEWNKVIGTNLTGSFLCAKYATPILKQCRGRIINIASTRALQSEANTEAYSASKGGILALTHALAASLGPEIKVNAISPGWIDVSALKKRAMARQEIFSEKDHNQHPAGRVGKAEDIVSMVLFLLREENDFITGQNFIIDGGMTKKMIYE